MLAHVYQFGTFGATVAWVFYAIAIGFALISAVHVYLTVRKRRARAKTRAARLGIQGHPILPGIDLVCIHNEGGVCRASTFGRPTTTNFDDGTCAGNERNCRAFRSIMEPSDG